MPPSSSAEVGSMPPGGESPIRRVQSPTGYSINMGPPEAPGGCTKVSWGILDTRKGARTTGMRIRQGSIDGTTDGTDLHRRVNTSCLAVALLIV